MLNAEYAGSTVTYGQSKQAMIKAVFCAHPLSEQNCPESPEGLKVFSCRGHKPEPPVSFSKTRQSLISKEIITAYLCVTILDSRWKLCWRQNALSLTTLEFQFVCSMQYMYMFYTFPTHCKSYCLFHVYTVYACVA